MKLRNYPKESTENKLNVMYIPIKKAAHVSGLFPLKGNYFLFNANTVKEGLNTDG